MALIICNALAMRQGRSNAPGIFCLQCSINKKSESSGLCPGIFLASWNSWKGEIQMPELCRFLGISIRMYFNDHEPPHFHVQYNDFRAVFLIADLSLIDGFLPPRIVALVLEWANQHRFELAMNWREMRETGTFKRIEPLV
jgi:hypothetical protein